MDYVAVLYALMRSKLVRSDESSRIIGIHS
jgi:hypothetical protein